MKIRKNLVAVPALLAAVLLSSCTSAPRPAGTARATASAPMEYVEVCERPDNCRKLSRLIMGTDHIGKRSEAELTELLDEAAHLGINTFDTAPIYIDSIEQRLGLWLKKQNRGDLHVITKGGFPRDLGPGTYSSRLQGTREQIVENVAEEIRGSSSRLNDAITIYLMHRDDADFRDYDRVRRAQTPVPTILSALSDPAIRSHYVMLGLSNWDTERVNRSQVAAVSGKNLVRPVCNSPYFSLLEMSDVTIHSGGVQVRHPEMMRADFQPGVKIMSYSPLGGFSILSVGWEKAKQNAFELKRKGDRYWGHVYDSIFHPANEKRFRRATGFTAKFNEQHGTAYTVDQMLNAYVLAHRRADFLIIGPTTVPQLRRSVEALQLSKMLTTEDLDYLYRNPD